MKKRNIVTLIIAAVCMIAGVISCAKDLEDEGVFPVTEYIGTVVENSTMQPIEGVYVKITDGENVYASTKTDAQGTFDFKDVNTDELTEKYSLLIDGSPLGLPVKKEQLKGFGNKIYDFKKIVLYDKTSEHLRPTVSATTVSDVTASSAVCNARITKNQGTLDITDKGFVWNTTQYPLLDTAGNNFVSMGAGEGEISSNLTSLTRASTYYVRAYAINGIGITYGEQASFITIPGLPQVTTLTISDITATTAKSGGNVTSDGGYAVTARGVCWNTTGTPDVNDQHTANGSGNGPFNSNMTGLSAGTTYYVRAYATNPNGTSYGSQQTFTTQTGNVTITLNQPTNVTSSTATCTATITNDGGAAVSERGFCWATSQYPTATGTHVSVGSGTGSFSSSLINLTPGSTYYVRAYAVNSEGTSYSVQLSFTTTNGLPTVTTDSITNITAASAVCSGNVTSDGGFSVTEKGFCWSTSQYPTTSGSHSSAGSGVGSFNGSISNLSINTTYYVRAYATNSMGTAYGEQISFTTANGLPIVTTTSPTFSNGTVATGGNVTSDGGFEVTARGICYGSLPYPDLTSNYTHTTDGAGSGYYSSSFSLPDGSGMYYVRAYATNVNGTAYGEQMTIINPYDELPTFVFSGHTYRVAPDPGPTMQWSNANSYCQNLTLYGHSDWRLPTKDELLQMCTDKMSIGGFQVSNNNWKNVWSSTLQSSSSSDRYYYVVMMSTCQTSVVLDGSNTSYYRYVRPIRMEN